MIPAIKSEFRKLLTVRSTYFIVIISVLIVLLFAGIIRGYQGSAVSLLQPNLLETQSTGAITFVGLILAFAGLLLVGHEYRYTTITYTLTASNRRAKVLLAKVIVVTIFAVITSALVAALSPAFTILGAHLHGLTVAPQTFHYGEILARCIFAGWAYAMLALLLVTIMRNQIGAIITFLLIPLIGENILSLLLKGNAKYLPFHALQAVADPTIYKGATTGQALATTLVYIGVGLLVAFVLFIRRDAN